MKREQISYEQAIEYFFGGLHHLATQPFPFKCLVCKSSDVQLTDVYGETVTCAMMRIEDCWKYIRQMAKLICAVCGISIRSGKLCEKDKKQFPDNATQTRGGE